MIKYQLYTYICNKYYLLNKNSCFTCYILKIKIVIKIILIEKNNEGKALN